MKLVFFSKVCFLDNSVELLKELSKKIDVVFVLEITPGDWGHNLIDLKKPNLRSGIHNGIHFFQENFPKIYKEYLPNVLEIYVIIQKSDRFYNPRNIINSIRLFLNVIRSKIKILQINGNSGILLFLLLLKIFSGLRTVINIHDPIPHLGEKPSFINKALNLFYIKICDKIVLHNSFQVQQFCKLHGINREKTKVIKLGIYDVYKIYKSENRPLISTNYVLFFGRLSPYKGIDLAFEIIKLTLNITNRIHFVIAGKSNAGVNLPQIEEEYTNNVTIINRYINNQEVYHLFNNATLVLLPYREATQSGVVLTAYSFNKPVIASNIQGLNEYIWDSNTGYLCPTDQLNVFANNIIHLFSDIADYSRICENIIKIKNKELSWVSISQQYISLYNTLIN